jgi:hypothetical protein
MIHLSFARRGPPPLLVGPGIASPSAALLSVGISSSLLALDMQSDKRRPPMSGLTELRDSEPSATRRLSRTAWLRDALSVAAASEASMSRLLRSAQDRGLPPMNAPAGRVVAAIWQL